RASRHNDHLARVQPIGQLIKVGNAGWHTAGSIGLVLGSLDVIDGLANEVTNDDIVLSGTVFGDIVDLCLRVVNNVVNVSAVGGVTQLNHTGTGLYQAAHN